MCRVPGGVRADRRASLAGGAAVVMALVRSRSPDGVVSELLG